ncbi:MAG: peptidylprolyl isomerase [Gammaproteobacteria bacterium]|jgi:peptidyl-prolyl cis-trans isomerase SurA
MRHLGAIQKLILLGIMCFSLSLTAEIKWLDKVVVLVEDDVILNSELERRTAAVKQQIQASGQTPPSDAAVKKQVLEQLVMESIQLQRARRAGVRISDEELNASIERIATGNNLTISQLSEQLESDGVKFPIFREDIRNEIMISRVRQGSVNQKVFVSEQEVDDVLKLIEEQGASSVQYKIRHMLIAIPESANADDIDDAREKAQSVRDRFDSGTDFIGMILAESDGSDALQGGDFGWRTIEQLPSLFTDSVAAMKKGQLSEAIRSPNGLHILYLEDRRGGVETQMVDEVNLKHILVEVNTITTDEKAEAQLLSIRREVDSGNTTFEEQAKVYSEDLSSASEGGDLGWAAPSAFQRLYGNAVDDLQDGQMSQPFKAGAGWYLVKRVGSRQTDQTEEFKRNRARQILFRRKFDEEQEAWMREIREQAYVKILDEELKD